MNSSSLSGSSEILPNKELQNIKHKKSNPFNNEMISSNTCLKGIEFFRLRKIVGSQYCDTLDFYISLIVNMNGAAFYCWLDALIL